MLPSNKELCAPFFSESGRNKMQLCEKLFTIEEDDAINEDLLQDVKKINIIKNKTHDASAARERLRKKLSRRKALHHDDE